MAIIIVLLFVVARSSQLDVGAVMGSMLGLGSAAVIALAGLFVGSAIGTFGLLTTPAKRRIGLTLTVVAGWVGIAVLGWVLWGFWLS